MKNARDIDVFELFSKTMDYLDGDESALDDIDFSGQIVDPVHGVLVKRYSIPWGGWYADVWEWSDGHKDMDFDTMD